MAPDSTFGDEAEALARRLLALREQSGIRLDRDGRFWHRGAPVEHPGLAAAFHRWLTTDEKGRYVLRTDRDWCVVEVEDAPLVARSIDEDDGRILLQLSDGTVEPLDASTLEQAAGDHVLYCSVSRGERPWPVRFSRPAYYQLLERLENDGAGQPVLRLEGKVYSVRTRAARRK
jgi:hypothetical protein